MATIIPTITENTSFTELLNAIALFLNEVELAAGESLVTTTKLSEEINKAANSFKQPYPTQEVAINSSGEITVSHLGKISIVYVDTNGQVASDDLDTIFAEAPNQFNPGDEIWIRQLVAARKVNATSSGNLNLNGGNKWISGDGEELRLTYTPDTPNPRWSEIGRYPFYNPALYKPGNLIVASGVLSIDEDQRFLLVEGEYTGEVLATAEVTFPVSTTSGNIVTLWVDQGSGFVAVTSYSLTGAGGGFDAIGFETQVNTTTAINGGYTASSAASVTTISAPVGSGASPNGAWSFYITETGSDGITPTTATFWGAAGGGGQTDGVDGTPASDTIDTINSGSDGQTIILYNNMGAGKTLATSLAGNIADEYVIGPSDSAIMVYNEGISKWSSVTKGSTDYLVEFDTSNLQASSGTFNSLVVTNPTSANNNWQRHFSFDTGGNDGVDGSFIWPVGVVLGGTMTVRVKYQAETASAGNVYLHFGWDTYAVSDDVSNVASATFVNQTEAMPGSADTLQEFSLSVTIPTTSGAGEQFNFILFREPGNAADTYTDNFELMSIDFTLPVR